MSNRGRRGGAAALFAARMTEEIEPTDAERDELGGDRDDSELADQADDDGAGDDQADDDDAGAGIDYSHEDDQADDEPDPEPTPETDKLSLLEKQLADMQAERDAERAASRVADEAAELRSHQTAVHAGIGRAKAQLEDLNDAYAEALKANDHKKAASINIKIAETVADLRDFDEAADEVAAAIDAFKKGKRRAPPADTKPAPAADPFEESIKGLSPRSQEWARSRKADLTKSPARGQKAFAAHLEAIELGHKPDSDAYFAHIDKEMGYKAMPKTPEKKPKPTGAARVAAPGGQRSAPTAGDIRDVKLSREEVQTARQLGMSLKDYAAHKKEIIQNGKNPARGGPTYSNISPQARR